MAEQTSSSDAVISIVGGLGMGQLSAGTRMVLQRFTEGQMSRRDLAAWLVESDYDTDLPLDERNALGGIRLILIDVAEGARPESEMVETVTATLKGEPRAGRQSA